MKTSQRELSRKESAESAEETLRMIASLPAPNGLVERVQTKLRTASRTGGVAIWPLALVPGGWSYGSAVRGAAAAAIVCVVAGGGWRIYSRVQPGPSAKIMVMPAPAGPARGFSIGGSVHTPDPMRGSVVTHQAVPEPGALTSETEINHQKGANPGKKLEGPKKSSGHASSGQPTSSPR